MYGTICRRGWFSGRSLARAGAGGVYAVVVMTAGLIGAGCTPHPTFKYDAVGVESIRADATKTPPVDMTGLAFLRPGENRPAYRLGPLDQVSIQVVGRPDLGSQTVLNEEGGLAVTEIAPDGNCYLPGLGRFQAAGLTAETLRITVRDLYGDVSSGIRDPEVVVYVVVTRSSSVFMDGEVVRPGKTFFRDSRLTLGEMVAAAGGLKPTADARRAELVRGGKVYPLDYWGAQQGRNNLDALILQDGDHVFFPTIEEQKVYVFGEVKEQGEFAIPVTGLSLLDALALAKGPDPITASTRNLFLMRPESADTTVYKLHLGELLEKSDVQLGAGDRLYVPSTGLANFERTFRQMLPFFTLSTTLFLIIYGIERNSI